MGFLHALLLILIIGSFENGSAHEDHHNHHLKEPDLPLIPVQIRNDSDVFLSLTINSLCLPRVILKPGESIISTECLRWGLAYQVQAVFYTNHQILETRSFIFVVRPNEPWIFCKLSEGETQCD